MSGRILSVSIAPYDGHPAPAALDSLASLDVKYVEPAYIVGYTEPFDESAFAPARAAEWRGWLAASGLTCHAVSAHVDLGREETAAAFPRRMDFAREIGARVINTNAALRARGPRFLDAITALGRRAEAIGLVIGLENPGNGEDNLINTAADGLALVAALGLPAVRLNYDPGNTVSHRPGGVDPAADAVAALPGCGHFHLKDVRGGAEGWCFVPIGEGEVDCDRVLAALARLPDLPVSIELPLRLRRGPDAQPLRAPDPVDVVTIERALRASLDHAVPALA